MHGPSLKDLSNEHAPSNVKDVLNRLSVIKLMFCTPRYSREDARYIRH